MIVFNKRSMIERGWSKYFGNILPIIVKELGLTNCCPVFIENNYDNVYEVAFYSPYENAVHIKVNLIPNQTSWDTIKRNCEFEFVNHLNRSEYPFFVLAHELTHYRQFLMKKLQIKNNDIYWTDDTGTQKFAAKSIGANLMKPSEYENLPWEREANDEGIRIVNKILRKKIV